MIHHRTRGAADRVPVLAHRSHRGFGFAGPQRSDAALMLRNAVRNGALALQRQAAEFERGAGADTVEGFAATRPMPQA